MQTDAQLHAPGMSRDAQATHVASQHFDIPEGGTAFDLLKTTAHYYVMCDVLTLCVILNQPPTVHNTSTSYTSRGVVVVCNQISTYSVIHRRDSCEVC